MKEITLEETVTISKYDFEDMLIYAQRYAIGRTTFAPQTVCDIINTHINHLNVNTLTVIMCDIERCQDEGNLGKTEIDGTLWETTLVNIIKELSYRESKRQETLS